jgi:hypothetical protein
MSKVLVEILADYGTIPRKIGECLLRHNGSRLGDITADTGLSSLQVSQGLAIMIQRRLVKYFMYERETRYSLDANMLHRRLYFPLYLCLIEDEHSRASEAFGDILLNGIMRFSRGMRSIEELLEAEIVRMIPRADGSALTAIPREVGRHRHDIPDEEAERKSKARKLRDEKGYCIVDFSILDALWMDRNVLHYVRNRYSATGERVYGAVLKSNVATPGLVAKSLGDMKKNEAERYLRYLNNGRVIKRSLDGSDRYFADREEARNLLSMEVLNRVLETSGTGLRRIFNLVRTNGTLEDKDITFRSLLGSNTVKKALFMLHANGCVLLGHRLLPDGRPSLLWQAKPGYTMRCVALEMRKHVGESLLKINRAWLGSHNFGDEAEEGELMRLMGLASDLLTLGIEE